MKACDSKYIVYILRNTKSGKLYTGYTSDLETRIKRHNGTFPTKSKSYTHKHKGEGEWILCYKKEFQTHTEAAKKEKWLKSGIGREWVSLNIIKDLLVDPPTADF